jgi:hypothetical protein
MCVRPLAGFLILIGLGVVSPAPAAAGSLRAGAFAQEINPTTFPVIVNGGFLAARSDRIVDPIFARAIVLDDGATRLAVVVVDLCMMPRDLLDRAKAEAESLTGIPAEKILISATHTHSTPSTMPSLGTPPDPNYIRILPGKIARAIDQAARRLAPAEIGWTVVDDPVHTNCRRWIRRPDRLIEDPFGLASGRANMHPGYQNPDALGPSGPIDPALSILMIRHAGDARPLALLANYSMHYFGATAVSPDYFGKFADRIGTLLDADPDFVGIMSQGTSGDQHWMDYAHAPTGITLDRYAAEVADVALGGVKSIASYRAEVNLAMAETKITLGRRLPDASRLDWARKIAAGIKDREPATLPEVYALEAIAIHDEPTRELIVQAIRVGDLGFVSLPNEVYALTGLKIKALSPLPTTVVIELANGAEGYIPPPEQHALGGYTTWPARTAGLEVAAETKLTEAAVALLETVSGKPRRVFREPETPYARAVSRSGPIAMWRLGRFGGPEIPDEITASHAATAEPGVVFHLDGPVAKGLAGTRAVQCASGRIACGPVAIPSNYSLSFWFCNMLPDDARNVTGYLASIGTPGDPKAPGDHLAIGGTASNRGRLVLFNGNEANGTVVGRSTIQTGSWHHVLIVREGDRATLYLDGREDASGRLPITRPAAPALFLGGRSDGFASFEGKLTEAALFDRAIGPEEASALHAAGIEGGADR